MNLIGLLKGIFGVLDSRQKRHFYILQFAMLISSVVELVGVGSVAPFIAMAINPQYMHENEIILWAQNNIWDGSEQEYLVALGLLFFVLILLSNMVQFLTRFILNRFSFRLGAELSAKLNASYLGQPVPFFTRNDSSRLMNNVITQSFRVADQYIIAVLSLNAKLFSIFMLSAFLLIISPVTAAVGLVLLGGAYKLVSMLTKNFVVRNGRELSLANSERIKILNESYNGIREVKLYSLEGKVSDYFRSLSKRMMRRRANNNIVAECPYFLMEVIAFGSIVLLAVYLILVGGAERSLPVLALYAMIGYKLLPAFQVAYRSTVSVRDTSYAWQTVLDGIDSGALHGADLGSLSKSQNLVLSSGAIKFIDVSFGYGEKEVFSELNFEIPEGKVVGLVGASGSGKSSLIDLIAGFDCPASGKILVGGVDISKLDLRQWQSQIGYVPQEVHMIGSTIAENVAFGVDKGSIDITKVIRTLEQVCLEEYAEDSLLGIWRDIGEKGNKLSGGQKQRLGIARALYRDAKILVFDEATSALDSETESRVVETIYNLAVGRTLFMSTHNVKILARADIVISLSKSGEITLVSQG